MGYERNPCLAELRTGQYNLCRYVCPHMGGPLHDGMVENCVVACTLHASMIDLCTGEVTNGDLPRALTFPVKVEDGTVFLDASVLQEELAEREEGAA